MKIQVFCICIINDCSQAYIVYTLYCIPYIIYPILYTQKKSIFLNFKNKKFQEFLIFQKFHKMSNFMKKFSKFKNFKFQNKKIIITEYYMSKSVSHAVSTREPYITPRATGPRGDIGRGLIWHVIQILTCNVHYIMYFKHVFDNTRIL
jgi:hypothetical protein